VTTLLDPLEDLPPGIAQYEDYHTIDWQREIARDRMRHRFIVGRWRKGQCFEKLKSAHDAWSGWICVLLVGCVAGINFILFLFVYSLFLLLYVIIQVDNFLRLDFTMNGYRHDNLVCICLLQMYSFPNIYCRS